MQHLESFLLKAQRSAAKLLSHHCKEGEWILSKLAAGGVLLNHYTWKIQEKKAP